MVLLSEINLDGLSSDFAISLEGDDCELQIQVDDSIIDDFNKRNITPRNFNEIIRLCDYLNIQNTEEFIIKNSLPTFFKYKLDEDNLNKINLPKIMTNLNLKNKDSISIEISKYGLLKWLEFMINKRKNGIKYINTLVFAKLGNLDCLKYAHERGCPWNEWVCSFAAENGHFECLKYAHENKCPWDEETCINAAKNGNLECLKYAHENGCEWDEMTCTLAACYGHLDCLKYAHGNGCEWSFDAPWSAAQNGQLECLKYLHEEGCSWTVDTCEQAARHGHLDCLKYAYENGCPFPEKLKYEDYISDSPNKRQKI